MYWIDDIADEKSIYEGNKIIHDSETISFLSTYNGYALFGHGCATKNKSKNHYRHQNEDNNYDAPASEDGQYPRNKLMQMWGWITVNIGWTKWRLTQTSNQPQKHGLNLTFDN